MRSHDNTSVYFDILEKQKCLCEGDPKLSMTRNCRVHCISHILLELWVLFEKSHDFDKRNKHTVIHFCTFIVFVSSICEQDEQIEIVLVFTIGQLKHKTSSILCYESPMKWINSNQINPNLCSEIWLGQGPWPVAWLAQLVEQRPVNRR